MIYIIAKEQSCTCVFSPSRNKPHIINNINITFSPFSGGYLK